jgi:hypothetical protein
MRKTYKIRKCRTDCSCHRRRAVFYRSVKHILFSVFIICFTAFLSVNPAFADKRTLKGVGLIDSESEFKILIMAADSDPISDYHLAYFHSPSRLLVDLAGQWDFPGYTVVKAENETVEKIRVGEHPDKLRIAVDLKGKAILSPIVEEIPGAIALVIKEDNVIRYEENGISGKLTDIRAETIAGEFKLTLSGNRPINEYKSYMLADEKPPKFVIDIPGKWKNQSKSILPVESDMVERIRIGEHSGFLRVVTDLTETTPITPVIGKSDRELVLTIKQ